MELAIRNFVEAFDRFSSSLPDNLIYMIRIVICAACGAAIGIERSKRQKEAGIRTHLIVAIGSALMMIVSKYAFDDVVRADASRIAANVITGVSFLGAGVIFVKDSSIKGLTTAAGIWATSGIGLAIGGGMIIVGVFSTILIIILQIYLHKYAGNIEGALNTYIKVTLKSNQTNVMNRLIQCLDDHQIEVVNQRVKRNKDETYTVNLAIKVPREERVENLSYLLEEDEDVVAIEV
ncbi:MAG: MgtC/SapB family protein [Oscillospiraceae bacterium]|nr:MgtC/SapB family protein [Oscillospiraceae bacterium]